MPFEKNFSFLEAMSALEPLEPLDFFGGEEPISLPEVPLPDDDLIEIDELSLTMAELSDQLGKTPQQIRHLIGLVEKGNYHAFTRKDGKFTFSGIDQSVLETLFDRKETLDVTWEDLLSQYFNGQ